MSFSKDVGEVSARYRSAGEVPSVTYPSGTHVVFTAPGSATSGQYGLFEWNMTGTRGGADPHFHKTFQWRVSGQYGAARIRRSASCLGSVMEASVPPRPVSPLSRDIRKFLVTAVSP